MSLPRLTRPEIRERELHEQALSARLSRALGSPLDVRLTRNRKRLLALRSDRRGNRTLRAHVAFAEADDHDLAIIVAWMKDEPGGAHAARTLFSRFRERIDEVSQLRAVKSSRLNAPGLHHDLNDILRDVHATFFPELERIYIAWSGREGRARKRRLGSWSPRERLIRIHSVLDDPDVPRYFIAHVVHHELCHAALDPPLTPTGRRRVHGHDFRRLENMFPDLERAREWERRNARLLMG